MCLKAKRKYMKVLEFGKISVIFKNGTQLLHLHRQHQNLKAMLIMMVLLMWQILPEWQV